MPALGRRVHHDPRSRAFPAEVGLTRRPVLHRVYGKVLDQGNLGSCVGNAAAHALNSKALHSVPSRLLTEDDAVRIYTDATAIDPWPGQWPPDDTGTDANSAAKALRDRGVITSWTHCFGIDQTLGALQLGPVMLGIGWHQSMWTPDARGYVHPDGNVEGGHEVLIRGDDCRGTVTCRNSWGPRWGLRGHFRLTYDDLDALLRDQGDATVLHRAAP